MSGRSYTYRDDEALRRPRGEQVMKIEFVITVDKLPSEHREKFLRGFMNSLGASKLEFGPPYEWDVREVTEEERQLLYPKKKENKS